MWVYCVVFIHADTLPIVNNTNDSILSLHRNADPGGNLLTVDTPDITDAEDCSNSILSCLLHKSSSNVNCQDNYGSTPLHYAAAKGNPRSVEELIRYGRADVNVSGLHTLWNGDWS